MIYHGLSALHILMEHQSNTTEKGDPFLPELLDRDLYTSQLTIDHYFYNYILSVISIEIKKTNDFILMETKNTTKIYYNI